MEGRGDAELGAPSPQRVVIVERPVAESVHPVRQRTTFGNRAGDGPAQHDRPKTEIDHGVLELGQRLLRCERGDARYRDQPVGVGGVLLGQVGVERGRHGLAQLGIADVDGDEAVGRVQDGDVEAELVEPLVEQAREHRSRPVEGVTRGDAPPRGLDDAKAPAHLFVDSLERPTAVDDGVEALRHRFAGQVDQQVPDEGKEFDQVSVAVDDRVVQLRPDAPDLVRRLVVGLRHSPSPDAVILRTRPSRGGSNPPPKRADHRRGYGENMICERRAAA